MKEKLLAMLKAKEEMRSALVTKSTASVDVVELRGLNSQMDTLNAEIVELRSMIDGLPDEEDQSQRTKDIEALSKMTPEERALHVPGTKFTPHIEVDLEGRSKADLVQKAKEERGKALLEKRAVTVASAGVLLAKVQSTEIGTTFNKVSGLLDMVSSLDIPGGESYSQPFEKDTPEGDYSTEGGTYANADTVFGNADITKSKVTAYSETTEELKKLPAAAYEDVVMAGVGKSVRRKITRQILIGTGAANTIAGIFSPAATAIDPATDLKISKITNTTLSEIQFSYGGDEDVEDQAVLVLNKMDLKGFSQLRNNDGSAFHKITVNGNTGTIDTVPYVINSACKALSATGTATDAYCMAYGPMSNYRLVTFSPLDVQRSEDFKFSTGQICHRGSVFIGGNVIASNGFLRIKKAAAV